MGSGIARTEEREGRRGGGSTAAGGLQEKRGGGTAKNVHVCTGVAEGTIRGRSKTRRSPVELSRCARLNRRIPRASWPPHTRFSRTPRPASASPSPESLRHYATSAPPPCTTPAFRLPCAGPCRRSTNVPASRHRVQLPPRTSPRPLAGSLAIHPPLPTP